jgi:Protein of unknown function (DUF459)
MGRTKHVGAHPGASRPMAGARLAVLTLVGGLALVAVMVGVSSGSAASGPWVDAPAANAPRVLGVHPDMVRGRGGGRILVTGRTFAAGVHVTVGGRTARLLKVRNPDALFALVPPGLGTEVVRVTGAGGTSADNASSVVHYANRVLVVGDSLGIDLGWGFTPALDSQSHLTVIDDAVGSSGLVRNDFYDWPAHLRADVAATHPDVVVTMFGTNDQQSFSTPNGVVEIGTTGWSRLYAARVREIATIVRRAGATLVWVGLPRMGPQSVLGTQFVTHLVALDRSTVTKLPRATFVDAWQVFTTPAGAYTPYVKVAPHDWQPGHAPDDTHLTPSGAAVIDARAVADLWQLLTGR